MLDRVQVPGVCVMGFGVQGRAGRRRMQVAGWLGGWAHHTSGCISAAGSPCCAMLRSVWACGAQSLAATQ